MCVSKSHNDPADLSQSENNDIDFISIPNKLDVNLNKKYISSINVYSNMYIYVYIA